MIPARFSAPWLLPLALGALLLGIVVGSLLPFSPAILYVAWFAAVLSAVIAGVLRQRPRGLFPALLLLSITLLGAARTRDQATPTASDVSHLAGRPSLWVRGRVESDVEAGERGAISFTLAVQSYWDFEQQRRVSGHVHVTTRDCPPPLPGDLLWIRGRITQPPPATNPGGFDYRAYLARRGIFCRMTVSHTGDVQQAGERQSPILAQLATGLRTAILNSVAKHLPSSEAGLLGGLLLSQRTHIPADMDEAFARTGTVHVLSVSGLHMATLAGFLALAFRLFAVPRRLTAVLSIGLLWIFAMAAGGGTAVVRSALMATLVLAAPLVRRASSPIHTLTAAGFLLLLTEPGALFDAGLQLSFATVGTLLLLLRPLESEILPFEAGMDQRSRMTRWILGALLVGGIAQVGSAPLVAYHFNRLSLIAPIANLPIALLTEGLLLGGLGAAGLSYLLPSVLLTPAWALLGLGLRLLRWLTLAFAAVPGAAFSVASPPAAAVVLYYVLLGSLALILRRRAQRRVRFFIPPDPDDGVK